MSKIWCDDMGCYYNKKCRCKADEVFCYDGQCISCRYSKPQKGEKKSRDLVEVQRDRHAKQVSDKIMASMLERMRSELKHGTEYREDKP